MENIISELSRVFKHVRSAYASCASLKCQAHLKRTIQTDTLTATDFSMRLAFLRPKNLFINWSNRSRPANENVILTGQDGVAIYRSSHLEWHSEASIEDAIARYAGVSSGLTVQIPSLLVGSTDYALIDTIEGGERRVVDGNDVYCIFGVGPGCVKRKMTIRATDYMILTISDSYSISNGVVDSETRYEYEKGVIKCVNP